MKKISIVITGILLLNSCVQDSAVDPLSELTKRQLEEQVQDAEVKVSDEEFYALIQAIPTPLQSTALMQAIGVEFNPNLMLSTDKGEKADTWFNQSINLGILGADLGYANVYGETRKSLQYLGSIRGLADKLKIGQFFDVESVKEMIEKQDNIDELINVSQMNFQKMNDYLQKQNRGKISVTMILGGWIEGLYLSTNVASDDPDNDILYDNVSEQKLSLSTIELLLDMYASDKYLNKFKQAFQPIITAFDNVEILYTEGEITQSEDENGNLIVEDSSSSEIIFTQKDLKQITTAVNDLRNKLLNNQL